MATSMMEMRGPRGGLSSVFRICTASLPSKAPSCIGMSSAEEAAIAPARRALLFKGTRWAKRYNSFARIQTSSVSA